MNRSPHLTAIERMLPTAVLLGILLLSVYTLYPFLPAMLWAVMLAIAVEPRYQWLVQKLGGRRLLAAWIMGTGLSLAVVIPAIGLARALLAFLPDALSWFQQEASTVASQPPEQMTRIPGLGPHIATFWKSFFSDASGLAAHFGDEFKSAMLWALQEVKVLGTFVFEFAIGALLAVVLVYRSDRVIELFGEFLDRIGGPFARRMAVHAVVTTRLAVRGVLGAALAQTVVAAVPYLVAGVPHWIVWTGLTFILSLLQVGPLLVLLPMSLWLWASDRALMALFVFLWSMVVVNLTDNVVRPMLVSQGSSLPTSLAFLGAVGGLIEWGVVGVFLGPVIVAVGYELIIKWLEPDTLQEEEIT